MWGIVPAAGAGTRLRPLAFSKELLPVGSHEGDRPRAVSEYLLERLIIAGADKICFVIAPRKYDILEYYEDRYGRASLAYVIQKEPAGLCDAMFQAAPLIAPDEIVAVGLPDTIWFPEDALRALPNDKLSFLLFPVEQPQFFDAVVMDGDDRVQRIDVKQQNAGSNWIWGAFKMPGAVFHELHRLWLERDQRDEYFGTLVNAWIERGGNATGVRAGASYVDVGTLAGYRAAMHALGEIAQAS